MKLLERSFNVCTPWGNYTKKLKDFIDSDFHWLTESDKKSLFNEFKEEYQSLLLENQAIKEEHYRVLTLKCKDCDSEARLKLAEIELENLK